MRKINGILEAEISDYEENLEELRSLKCICRSKEEFEDLEKEVNISGELINTLQNTIRLLQARDRMRSGNE